MNLIKLRGLAPRLGYKTLSVLSAVVIASSLTVAGPSSAATALFEDFSGGLNGWSSVGGSFGVNADGGPAGVGDAYMFTQDTSDDAMAATFGTGWSGNLSDYNNGTLSFDFFHEELVQPTLISSFGRITVTGSAGSAMADAYSGDPLTTWTSAALGFDASTFGQTEEQWAAILNDVTSISIRLESWSRNTETVGLDNVQLAPVPLPASALLLLGGLGALVVMRRRSAAA